MQRFWPSLPPASGCLLMLGSCTMAVAQPMAPEDMGWRDAEPRAGDWRYRGDGAMSSAQYGDGETSALVLYCNRDSREVMVALPGARGTAMTIRTTNGAGRYPAGQTEDSALAARLAAFDPLLDGLAYSRGRFAIEIAGEGSEAETITFPLWAEPVRVIEDCRG